MRKAFVVAVVFAAVVALLGVGTAEAATRGVPRLIHVRASAHRVHGGDLFTIAVAARNRSGGDYAVGFPNIPAGVTLVDEVCRAGSGGPSPDTPDCEYSGYRAITHTTGVFEADATVSGRIHIDVCTQSLDANPPKPACGGVSFRVLQFGDVAHIVSVTTSSLTAHPGGLVTFTLDVAARDRGSNDYYVNFAGIPAGVNEFNTCQGKQADTPSADGPFCEYDAFTTTTSTITHTVGHFEADATVPRLISIDVCAQSFNNPSSQPECRRISVRLP